MSSMMAVVCHGPQDYRLESVDIPEPGPGEALVRVEAVGICASDVKCYQGAAKFWGTDTRPAYVERGVIPGHEFAGRIAALGDGAGTRWGVAEGDRVVSEQIVPCWSCRYCLRGSYHMCAPHRIYGFKHQTAGAMAEYMIYPADALVHRVSTDMPAAWAAFAEPLSCALHAVQRADVRFGDVVVVAGCGPIGLGMVAGARRKGPGLVVALDTQPSRLETAELCGADVVIDVTEEDVTARIRELTSGDGADAYLEATGHPAAVPQGLDLLRKQGRFIEYSVFKDEVTVDWSVISDDKELDVLGAHLGPDCWPTAIQILEEGGLPMDRICADQLPLEDFQRGFDLVADGTRSVKVSLIPPQANGSIADNG